MQRSRVTFAPLATVSIRIESRLTKIRVEHQTTLQSDYPGLSAPNHIDQLTFDDFRIYTRAVLRMAYWLNDAVELTADDLDRRRRQDHARRAVSQVICLLVIRGNHG